MKYYKYVTLQKAYKLQEISTVKNFFRFDWQRYNVACNVYSSKNSIRYLDRRKFFYIQYEISIRRYKRYK